MVKPKKSNERQRLKGWKDCCRYISYLATLRNYPKDIDNYRTGNALAFPRTLKFLDDFREGVDRGMACAREYYASAKAIERRYAGVKDTFTADEIMLSLDDAYNNLLEKINERRKENGH